VTENFQESTELIKCSSTQCNQTRGSGSQDNRLEVLFSTSQFLSSHFITIEHIKDEAA